MNPSEAAAVVPPAARRLTPLDDPERTKGTAFTGAEREQLGLLGLLPARVTSLDEQVERCWQECQRQADDLRRYVYLRSLQDRNERLFYAVLAAHVQEAMPLIYTPTVADACRRFSEVWRGTRGLFVSYPDRGRLRDVLRNRPHQDVDVIVVTDGQRVLGIGDQGVGGIGIAIGKLSLYTLLGGVDPARTLPIVLDVGTDNPDLLDDPNYLGWRHPRVGEEDYYAFLDEFVEAVSSELPDALLQWEDLSKAHALPVLDRYRRRMLTFNDDIQGTAAVTVGALLGAVKVAGTRLRDQNVVMLGAGSAGIGVMELIVDSMVDEGLDAQQARRQCWVLNRTGLLTTSQEDLSAAQQRFAHHPDDFAHWGVGERPRLLDVVGHAQASVLLGLSTSAGAFDEEVIRTMSRGSGRPIVFPLSNPTANAEARPDQIDAWTDGRALIATGSPFPPLERGGARVAVAQCNNAYVFPAVGLAVKAVRATRVTDNMMRAAARALGAASPALSDDAAPLLPPWADMRAAVDSVALAVAQQAVADGVAPPIGEPALIAALASSRWEAAY